MRPPAFVIIVLFIFVSSIFISLKYGNVLALLTISSDNLQVKRPATQQLKLGEIASVDLYGSGFDRNFSLNLVKDVTHSEALVASFPIEGVFNDSLVYNHHLYLGSNLNGIKVIDLSRPQKPQLKGEYLSGRSIVNIHRKGDQLYLACGRSGVAIMQIQTDGLLVHVGDIQTGSTALEVRTVKGLLAVAAGSGGVLLYDINQPEEADLISRLDVGASVATIAVYQDLIYVVARKNNVEIYEFDESYQPLKIGELLFLSPSKDIKVINGNLYLANASQVFKYDLVDPRHPRLHDTLDNFGSAVNIYDGAKQIYVTDSFYRLSAVDLNLQNREQQIDLASDVRTVVEMEGFLIVAGSESGVLILDRQKFSQAESSQIVNTPGSAQDVYIKDHWLYIADRRAGVLLKDLNLIDAAHRQISPRWGESFCVANNLLYVAQAKAGVEVFDLSEPGQPQSVAFWPSLTALRVSVWGNFLALANGFSGVEIYDISNLKQPLIVSTIDEFQVLDVVFDQNRLYLATKSNGLQLYELDQGGKIHDLAGIMTPFPMNQFSNAVAVVVKNNIAYVANGLSGLMIVDFNRPDKPIILSLLDIEGFSKGVYVKGDRAFVVSQAGGVSVVNAENLKAPRLESYMAVQGLSRGFQVDGGKFYLPRNNLGVSMLPVPLRVEEIDRKSSNHILCTLPMVEFSGQYDLQVGTQDGLIVHEGVINYQ